MSVNFGNLASHRVRYNPGNDSHAFIAACEAFSSEKNIFGRPSIRVHQPPGGVSTIKFGEHLTAKEAEALLKNRPGSDLKKREMHGNLIFNGASSENACRRSKAHSFGINEEIVNVSYKISELKGPELSGHDIFSDSSQVKLKEIIGHDVFLDNKPRARDVLGGFK